GALRRREGAGGYALSRPPRTGPRGRLVCVLVRVPRPSGRAARRLHRARLRPLQDHQPVNDHPSVDLLFFGAHADDVELSVGGTIAKMVESGLRAGIVDLTRGEMGTRGTPQIRKREAEAAARILGATFRQQLDLGDGNLRTDR